MDRQGRRGRCGRGHSYSNLTTPNSSNNPSHSSKPWTFLSSFYSFLILASLITLIYMMLDYQCTACAARCDLKNITKNLDDIAKNLSLIKSNYNDLETKISQFSLEIPKLEGQIGILEAFVNTMDNKDIRWDSKSHMALPNVDVILKKHATRSCRRNFSKKPVIHAPIRPIPMNQS